MRIELWFLLGAVGRLLLAALGWRPLPRPRDRRSDWEVAYDDEWEVITTYEGEYDPENDYDVVKEVVRRKLDPHEADTTIMRRKGS